MMPIIIYLFIKLYLNQEVLFFKGDLAMEAQH